METNQAIETRRSIKRFDPDHVISEAECQELLRLTVLTPTAFNIQNWRFVVVRDPALRQALRAVSWHQPQVTEASLLVIICADLLAWDRAPERYWQNAAQGVRDNLVTAIRNHFRGQEVLQRDEAIRSGGLAAQTLMLAAKAMGYDSCPMTGCDFAEVGRLINLPTDHLMVMMVAIGKGVQPPQPRGGQLSLAEVAFLDRFPAR